jgi:hypothetical protein
MRGKILTVTAAAACVVGVGLGYGAHVSATVVAHSSAARGGQPAAASALAIPGAARVPALPAAGSAADPDTTVTFSVNVGGLSMTVPASADLGSGDPGTTIGPSAIGAVTVTDVRAALGASWTATASSTSFTTGAGTPAETIPAGDVTYDPGAMTSTTGTGTFTPSAAFTLSGTPQDAVAATAITGDNTGTWDPALSVAVPAAAVGGVYTGTLTQSVA